MMHLSGPLVTRRCIQRIGAMDILPKESWLVLQEGHESHPTQRFSSGKGVQKQFCKDCQKARTRAWRTWSVCLGLRSFPNTNEVTNKRK